jgi:ABC-type branched-subunit amino acid transport system ATPase component
MSTETRAQILEVAGLRRAFGGLVAVNDLGFEVAQGEIMGLLGPNGSGKTTALNLMSGVLRPDAGSIRLMGKDISGLAAYRIARLGLARTFQLVRVLDGMDCRENIKAGLAFQNLIWRQPRQKRGPTCCWTASVLPDRIGGRRPTSPISTANGLSLPARSRRSRACCCWTNGSRA